MPYFYEICVQIPDKKLEFYIVPTVAFGEKVPPLTVETVKATAAFSDFAKEHKIVKNVWANYRVFQTADDISALGSDQNLLAEKLQPLIQSGGAEVVCTSEIEIPPGKKTKVSDKTRSKNPKKQAAPTSMSKMIPVFIIVAIVSGFAGFWGGINLTIEDGKIVARERDIAVPPDADFEGLIMPEQVQISDGAESITVALDCSYFAVPREDIHLKGEVIGGVARITLPEFDRHDYFSHVAGHTWGWSTDPQATKIQYHGGKTYEFTENVKLYRVLVKYGGGSGTKDDPYIINYFDQLRLIAQNQARGYFKQTEDIRFPATAVNSPIDTVNELRQVPELERFEYDGGGFTISGLRYPLFGRVSGSVLKNINIVEANITAPIHKNYGFIVSEAYNYRYTVNGVTYETGETLIQNCSVIKSTMTVSLPEPETNEQIRTPPPEPTAPPQVLPGEDLPPEPTKLAQFAIGGISGLGGKIENCYAENITINANLSNYYLYVGGISGKPANVVNSGVYNLTISGNIFNAGGIAGSAGGSRLYNAVGAELPDYYGGNIQGCFVRSFTARVENAAGGIAGEGGTNAANAMISNNYAVGLDFRVGIFLDESRTNPERLGFSGGIIGADGVERYGHVISNCVSVANLPVIDSPTLSSADVETVKVAQSYAFYQAGILDVINRNAVHPDAPGEIFTGSFVFAEDGRNSDDGRSYAFPADIAGLIPIPEKRN